MGTELEAVGPIVAGVRYWRMTGALHVTVVGKATFAFVADATMQPVPPRPLVTDEPTDRSVQAPSDMAPHQMRADAVAHGFAYLPAGTIAPVRFAVYGRAGALFDKRLAVRGTPEADERVERIAVSYENAFGGPGHPDNPVGQGLGDTIKPTVGYPGAGDRTAGFGALAAAWPCRRQHLTADLPEGEVLELPASLDWAYFQAAPPDQRLPFLLGDEWVIAEGMHPEHKMLRSQLPGAQAWAKVTIAGQSYDPVAMIADLLVLDCEKAEATVTWRVSFACEDPTKAKVEVGLALSDATITWDEAAATEQTVALTISDLSRQSQVLPFVQRPAEAPAPATTEEHVDTGTVAVSPDAVQSALDSASFGATVAVSPDAVAAQAATPFATAPSSSQTLASPADLPGAPWSPTPAPEVRHHVDATSTMEVGPEQVAAALAAAGADASTFFHDARELAAVKPPPKPEPDPPASSDAEPLSLERCAEVAAELSCSKKPRRLVLARLDLTMEGWRESERHHKIAIDKAVRHGDKVLRQRYDEAYVSRWCELRGDFDDAAYQRCREAAASGDLGEVLEELRMSRPEWMRIERVWRGREQTP